MAKESKIQWTDGTWNPWHGCKKVSPGCKYCYMYRDKDRYGQDPTKVLRSKAKFNEPLKWDEPRLVFTCSWSDWFIEEADEWRDEAWKIIRDTPQHTYQILTKRPKRIKDNLPEDWGDGYDNVWLGVSIENNNALNRLRYFHNIPAKVRFASIEPLIESIDEIELYVVQRFIDWAIIGGESGNDTGKYRYRPCELHWIENIIETLKMDNIPVFVKQLGTHLAKELNLNDRHGGDISEWPEHIQIREMPEVLTPIPQ